jgi:hypothetical protein
VTLDIYRTAQSGTREVTLKARDSAGLVGTTVTKSGTDDYRITRSYIPKRGCSGNNGRARPSAHGTKKPTTETNTAGIRLALLLAGPQRRSENP